ncbi:exendin-4-like [Eublepharis macularius]|uniref:Exendin-4-like n=1 Tax=Eublepharis macularius TaxID=481883 RepID=A0AA97KP37_EUBMA|nr:exendin-4-like [Eublepharis macularius]
MKTIMWLCVLAVVIASVLPVSQQTADESGLHADVSKSLTSKFKRHGQGTFTSDLSKALDEEAARVFLQQAIEGRLSKNNNNQQQN